MRDMNGKPLFSVIIPVYNAQRYLREALDSVVAQTFLDWECVCVDDGSSDGSGAILDEYAKRDSRFVVIRQKNGGEGNARNTGLAIANGNWITWLDADDAYVQDRLEEANRLIALENPDLIRFRTCFENDATFGKLPRDSKSRDYRIYQGDMAKEWGWNVLMPAGMVWTWIARKDSLEGLSFQEGMRVKTDCIFSGWLAMRLGKVVQSEFRAYAYRQLPNSAIHAVRKSSDVLRFFDAALDLWNRQVRMLPEGVMKEIAKRRIRMCSECDIIDWVRMRVKADNDTQSIYVAYRNLRNSGLFKCRSIQQMRYRIPIWWWDKTGQAWIIQFMATVEKGARWLIRRQ